MRTRPEPAVGTHPLPPLSALTAGPLLGWLLLALTLALLCAAALVLGDGLTERFLGDRKSVV